MSRHDPNLSSTAVSTATMILLSACVALSGVAALVYLTAWTRQFATVFGASSLAAAIVLAACLGGVTSGAWLAQRHLHRFARPVFTFAWLQAGIAVAAIVLVPGAMWVADVALQALFDKQPSPPQGGHAGIAVFYLLAAFVALAIPMAMMGAMLPVLARGVVAEESRIARRVGALYLMNAAGAAGGALLAAFTLLPELGLSRSIWVAAGINGFGFLLAVAIARRVSPPPPPTGYSLGAEELVPGSLAPPPPPPPPPPRRREPARVWTAVPGTGWVLPLMSLAGAVAFGLEAPWARLSSHVVGGSIHTAAVLIAGVLAGIALGGGLGAVLARTRERAALALGLALIGAAVSAGVAWLFLEQFLNAKVGLPRHAMFPALQLPMTICLGMTYPLAVRVLARDVDDAAPASARVIAWTAAGAIAGLLAASLILLPQLRHEGAIRMCVIASAALGIAALWMLAPVRTAAGRIGVATVSALAIAGAALFRPEAPTGLLTSPLDAGLAGDAGHVLHYGVGRESDVVMRAQGGELALTTARTVSLIETPGALRGFSGGTWITPLAVLARPDTRDMLVLGFGGGGAIEAVPPSVQRIEVIESEPEVIEANRATASLRKRNPLADPRVEVVINDARGALRLTGRQYDAIVFPPAHPTAGASHLYTREFMRLVHERLKPGGVYVLGVDVGFLDERLMRSLTATLLSVYRELRVYRPDPTTVVFLASDLPLAPERRMIETGLPWRNAPLHYARYGINCVEDLVNALVLESEGARRLSFGSPPVTDDDNRIATAGVFDKGRGMTGDASGRLFAAQDPLQDPDSPVYGEWRQSLDFAYLVRRNGTFVLADYSLADRVARMWQILGATPEGEYARAYYFRMTRQVNRSNELLRLAIDDHPRDEAIRLEYLRGWVPAIAAGNAPPEIVELTKALSPLPAAVLAATRHAVRKEWRELAAADGQLAQLPWTHPWHLEAVELRVLLRLQVTSPDAVRRFGDEALLLLDRVLVVNPTLSLYGLRARAGAAAGRPDVMLESLSRYARLAARLVRAGASTSDTLRQDARSLLELLDSTVKAHESKLDGARVAEVRAEFERLLAN